MKKSLYFFLMVVFVFSAIFTGLTYNTAYAGGPDDDGEIELYVAAPTATPTMIPIVTEEGK